MKLALLLSFLLLSVGLSDLRACHEHACFNCKTSACKGCGPYAAWTKNSDSTWTPPRTGVKIKQPWSKSSSSAREKETAALRKELIRLHGIQIQALNSKDPKAKERLNARAGAIVRRITEKYSRTAMIPGLECMDDVDKTLEYVRQQRGPADRTPPETLLRGLHLQQLQYCRYCRKKK